LAWEQRLVELRLARPASDDSPGRDAAAEPAKAA
jgi:hypothetical protein